MAEIGLIASVIGVAGAALAASKALSDMIDQIRNAPEEIIAISKDTLSFHGIITNVHVAITDEFVVSKLETEQQILRAVKELEGPLKNCGTILTQMRLRIKSHLKRSDDGGLRVSSFDMRWIFQRKDIIDCRNRLETTKSTLNAALSSVVFLCHMKMMGSLGKNPDVLPSTELDVDAGSALREYAESIASRSPPPELDVDARSAMPDYVVSLASQSLSLNDAFESTARHAELPAKRLSISKQTSQEEPGTPMLDTFMTGDESRTPLEVPNSDLKATSCRDAIDARDIGKIELLLAENYDVNVSAAGGWTALHVAVEYCRIDLVQLLMEKNAHVNSTTSLGWTPILQAALRGQEDIVQALLNARDIDVNAAEHTDRWTSLHIAAIKGHENTVRILINAKNIGINATTSDGCTPLHIAAGKGHEIIVQTLLKVKNIDVNAKAHGGLTSLHVAADKGHEIIVQTLLKVKNINVNAKVDGGWTSLHVAAHRGHENTVQILINAKDIDVNATTDEGMTPLHQAARRGHENVVKMLLDSNADMSAETATYHETALVIAICARQEDTAILLIKRGSPLTPCIEEDIVSPLYCACVETCLLVVKALIEKGNSSGQLQAMLRSRSLHFTASRGSLEVLSQLVEAGADINARDRFGETPLNWAAWAGQLQTMDYLIAHGADLAAKNKAGQGYLQCLRVKHPDKYEEYVRELESGLRTQQRLQA